jgi:vacuolar-type H+-ATPase subunit I/STV1
MTMGTKSTEIKEDPRVLDILSGIQDQVTKLKELPETVKVLDERVASLETQREKTADTPASPRISGSISNETPKETFELELRDHKISDLETQIAQLESQAHRENIVLEWLNNLDQDSYYTLGVRKGYLEEINPEAQKPVPGELREPDPEVQLSTEKPEDLTDWAYSEILKGYIRIAEALNE